MHSMMSGAITREHFVNIRMVPIARFELATYALQISLPLSPLTLSEYQWTLKILLEYKNPKRTTSVKQRNIAVSQQINEGDQPKEIPEKEINPANELLEENNEHRILS